LVFWLSANSGQQTGIRAIVAAQRHHERRAGDRRSVNALAGLGSLFHQRASGFEKFGPASRKDFFNSIETERFAGYLSKRKTNFCIGRRLRLRRWRAIARSFNAWRGMPDGARQTRQGL
jgi:hypothetical protein